MKLGKLLLLAGVVAALPTLGLAASSIFISSTMAGVVTEFFSIPLVKGVIMTGTIGGGLFLVLKGFGIVGAGKGGDSIDYKAVMLGGLLTGIGLSYTSLVGKISGQFK